MGSRRGGGGASIVFAPVDVVVDVPDSGETLPSSGLFLGLASHALSPNSIKVFEDTTFFPPELANPTTVNSGIAGLVGIRGAGEELCKSCDFLSWGAWLADVNYDDNWGEDEQVNARNMSVAGWWVTGNVSTVGQLPTQGTAFYKGNTFGNIVAFGKDHVASGQAYMGWDFGKRAGGLAIRNFRAADSRLPSVNVAGRMSMPGYLASSDLNKFGGPLHGKFGKGYVTGWANGSFVGNGSDKAAAAIGNWNARSNHMNASGIFGTSR